MSEKHELTEFKLSIFPKKIPLILWSAILVFLGLNAYLWFNLIWYAGVAYLCYAFVFAIVFITIYCRKCYYYGRICPFMIGKIICALRIPYKTQKKRMVRKLYHIISLVSLITPTLIFIFVSLILHKESFVEILTQLLFLSIAVLDGFIVFIRTRNEIACRYCFNREQCFSSSSTKITN